MKLTYVLAIFGAILLFLNVAVASPHDREKPSKPTRVPQNSTASNVTRPTRPTKPVKVK
uniref:Uncharacterized protein n=1 Tax=Anopheles albimanus TaxID=7167 RepID=A0A182FS79_ANOAL